LNDSLAAHDNPTTDRPATEQINITDEAAGARLDAWLAAHLNVSRGRAHKTVERVLVNGATVKASYTLRAGDRLEIPPDDTPVAVPPVTAEPAFDLEILYEDEHLLIINKPRGLVVHPGAGQESGTLVDILRATGRALSTVGPPERAGIVHRLDKETSGVIAVCKTDEAHWKLAADFEARRVVKTYTAIVCGIPTLRGRIEAPIARSQRDRKKMAISREGRSAITEYEVVQKWAKFSLLKINLFTGRTHQIRVHLTHIGHAVVGDVVYGGIQRAIAGAPDDATRGAIEALTGQALHASRLAFEHPIFAVQLEFEAPLPLDMQDVVNALDASYEAPVEYRPKK
jgi:23S rRNA pseudouridine1911/1915/1917 synthase